MFTYIGSVFSHNRNDASDSEDEKKTPNRDSSDKINATRVEQQSDSSSSYEEDKIHTSGCIKIGAHCNNKNDTQHIDVLQQNNSSSLYDGEQPCTSRTKSGSLDPDVRPKDGPLFVRIACDKKNDSKIRKKKRKDTDPWINRIGDKCITKKSKKKSKKKLREHNELSDLEQEPDDLLQENQLTKNRLNRALVKLDIKKRRTRNYPPSKPHALLLVISFVSSACYSCCYFATIITNELSKIMQSPNFTTITNGIILFTGCALELIALVILIHLLSTKRRN